MGTKTDKYDMEKTIAELAAEVAGLKELIPELLQLRDRVARLEGQLEGLTMVMAGRSSLNEKPLPAMTTKQHAALQMCLRGANNAEIAARFGVTVNTAKVYVRSLFQKFGVNTRAGLILEAKSRFEAVPSNQYRQLSGGLPKDWDAAYVQPDPYWSLYGVEETGDGTEVN